MQAGLAFLPLTAGFFLSNVLSGRVITRFGTRKPMIVGALVDLAGFGVLAWASTTQSLRADAARLPADSQRHGPGGAGDDDDGAVVGRQEPLVAGGGASSTRRARRRARSAWRCSARWRTATRRTSATGLRITCVVSMVALACAALAAARLEGRAAARLTLTRPRLPRDQHVGALRRRVLVHLLAQEAAALVRPQPRVEAAARPAALRWSPSSTMRPLSSTISRSIAAMVDSRCAMAITVLPSISAVQALLDRGLDLGVERAGGLVEQQDRRVLEHHARDRDALALAARELDAALADMRVVARRPLASPSAGDELVRLGALGGGASSPRRSASGRP